MSMTDRDRESNLKEVVVVPLHAQIHLPSLLLY